MPDHDGEYTYETDYTNHLDALMVAADEHEGDKGENDFNDLVLRDVETVSHWTDYVFQYTGEIYSTSKEMDWDTDYLDTLQYGQEVPHGFRFLRMTVNGYNFTDGYRFDVTDDAVYARAVIDGQTTAYVRLKEGDYYFGSRAGSNPSFTVAMSDLSRIDGQQITGSMPEGALPTAWGRTSAGGAWEEIPVTLRSEYEYQSAHYYTYDLPDINEKHYVQIRYSMPEGMEGKAAVEYQNGLAIKIRPDSETINNWLAQGNVTSILFQNFAAYDLYVADPTGVYHWANPYTTTSNSLANELGLDEEDKAEFGAYRHRKNDDWQMIAATRTTELRKSVVSMSPNPTDQTHTVNFAISGCERTTATNLPDFVYEGWSCSSGVFYDLLPMGYSLDTTVPIQVTGANYLDGGRLRGVRVNGSNYDSELPAALESVETVENYKGTGRQLIVFRVKSTSEKGNNYGKYWTGSYMITGFGITFSAVAPYEFVPVGRLYNLVAFQRTDDLMLADGFTDEAYQAPQSTSKPPVPKGDDGHDVFYDINQDGDVTEPDTRYTYADFTPVFLRTIENGISKKVKASGRVFTNTDVSDLNAEYTYRLSLTASAGGITKNVVLYDVLENAANTDGHTGEIQWTGTFQRTAIADAVSKGIAVKVLYSTAPGLSYNAPENMLLENAPQIWSEVCPDDLSKITAVAFDLRLRTDGTEMEFEEDDSVFVDIIMKSPAELQEAESAYNRPAYNSTYVPLHSTGSTTSFNIGSRVEVALHDLQEITVKKLGQPEVEGEDPKPLAGATFTLFRCGSEDANHQHSKSSSGSDTCWVKVRSAVTMSSGEVTFRELDTGVYRIEETSAPKGYNGYSSSSYWWLFEVDGGHGTITRPKGYRSSGTPVEMGGDAETGYTLLNTPKTVSIRVYKYWSGPSLGSEYLPSTVRVNIYRSRGRNAQKEFYRTVEFTITSSGSRSVSLTVPQYYDGVNAYIYYAEEEPVPGFRASMDPGDTGSGTTLKITNVQETKEIAVTKVWQNADRSVTAPEGASVTFQLYADGVALGAPLVLTGTPAETAPASGGYEKEDWVAAFVNLPAYKYVKDPDTGAKASHEIVYVVKEIRGWPSYTAENEGEAADGAITNVQEATEVEGSKTWVDADDQDGIRPASITVRLLADGEEVASKRLEPDKDGLWTYAFDGLPKYRVENGETVEIVYTVKEDPVEGYETEIEGFAITNTHTPGTVALKGAKTWDDGDDQDGLRPESITIRLLADGEEIDSVSVSEKDGWQWQFANLPQSRAGTAIQYTIKEDVPEGYTATVNGLDVTNTHTPKTTKVEGTKTWDDGDNQDGLRPKSITIRLLADGKEVDSATVTEEGGWKWSFTGLPKYRDHGTEIVYSITEDAVKGYESKVDGYNVTNEHPTEPGKKPRTGDDSHLLLWLIVMLVSLTVVLGITYCVIKGRVMSRKKDARQKRRSREK